MNPGIPQSAQYPVQQQPPFDPAQIDDDADLIDIKELLRTLWRRRMVILGSVLFITSLALLIVFQLTPRYTASALLTLQTRQEAVVDIQAVMSGLSTDASVIRTELDVISSRRLIGKLVDTLKLTKDPEFNGALREPNPFTQALNPKTYLSHDWLLALGLASVDEETLSEEERQAMEQAKVVDAVTEALNVSNPKLSYTIQIAFESEDPKKAAQLANTLANLYLTDQLEAKFEATQRATDWLSERIGDLKTRVVNAEQAVQEYREKNEIIESGKDGTVNEQQLAELNAQLVTARTDLAEAEARYSQVKSRLGGRTSAASLGEVLNSPLIQRLGEQEAEVRRKLAEIAKRYGPRHPDTIAVTSELNDIRGKISEETAKITKSVENEVRVARARVDTLSQNLEVLKKENTTAEKARVELRELEREAQSSRVLLETFLSRFKETSNQEDLQQADARIISQAEMPVEASFPKKKLILAVAVVLSGMVGLGLAFLLEALDNGFRALEHVEKVNRIKGLGMIPKLTALKLKGLTPFRYAVKKPTSAYSEALRSVYTSLMFGHPGDSRPKSLLVTSSLPGEGKTTFSLSLALLLSRAGNLKVLYIEADLRRANIAKSMIETDEKAPSIAQYLSGAVEHWEECLFKDGATGLDLILAGGKTDYPQTLLQSDRMKRLVTDADERYDLVIIDTPPLLAVSDAVIISHYVDVALFVVKWESTARDAVRNALELLRKAGAPLGGAILTQVDVKRHAYYGYGDYASYYGRYGDYYAN
ncbi:GumC family protein [Thiorhodococcus fuscus]|uniref:non-specific protein-tyrosine kinase n=1 Tax=Thiorhodococcus fuscus TaxID=527200 RepID=A0ABW4YBT8_9GAMM